MRGQGPAAHGQRVQVRHLSKQMNALPMQKNERRFPSSLTHILGGGATSRMSISPAPRCPSNSQVWDRQAIHPLLEPAKGPAVSKAGHGDPNSTSPALCSLNAAKVSCCQGRPPHAHYFEMGLEIKTPGHRQAKASQTEGLNTQERWWQTLPKSGQEGLCLAAAKPCPVEEEPQKDKHSQKERVPASPQVPHSDTLHWQKFKLEWWIKRNYLVG